MLDADGTKDKSKLGANAILAVSLANAKAAADAQGSEGSDGPEVPGACNGQAQIGPCQFTLMW